jgi:hypothetical protein
MAALTLLTLTTCAPTCSEPEPNVAPSARATTAEPEAVESTPRLGPHLPIVVSRQSIDSADPYDVVQSNGADPRHRFEGDAVLAWHFITDRGHHYMVEHEGRAMMFDDGGRRIATIDSPPAP